METITKQIAATLFAHGFRLVDKEGNIYEIAYLNSLNMELYSEELGMAGWEAVNYDQIGTDYWILKRPYSQLTKSIVVDGKEIVPIVEVAKAYDNRETWVVVESRVSVMSDDSYEELLFNGEYFDLRNYANESMPINQLPLFQKLYSLHFIDLPEGTYKEIE